MVAAKVTTFGGMIPSVDDRLLPDQAATFSENCWLYSGALVGLPEPKFLRDCDSPVIGKAYRIPGQYDESTYLYDSVWMEFEDPNTDILHAPVFGDVYDRYYWVSTGQPARYNTRDRIADGDPPWLLGIPSPVLSPLASFTGGSGSVTTRAYVQTFVSAYGEEGAPGPPRVVSGKVDDTYTITLRPAVAADIGVDRNLAYTRLYRTITSSSGIATYFLVAEVPVPSVNTNYIDTMTDSTLASNAQLAATSWTPPPSDLEGFVAMPNGIIAGFRDNEIWFTEPYRPHAWPAAYVLTVEYPVVGLGVSNQTLVVCTKGYPTTISGSLPSVMTDAKLTSFEPCTARGSILSAPEGVYYASPNGLILVVPGRAENITRNLITTDKWQQLTGKTRFRSARLGTAYYGFGSVVPGVFSEGWAYDGFIATEDFGGSQGGVLIDPHNERVSFNLLSSPTPTYGVQNDQWSGEVLLFRDDKIYWLQLSDPLTLPQVATWRSKIFQMNEPSNLGAFKVYFTVPTNTPAQNPVRNVAPVQELAADQYGLIRIFADGQLVMTRELRTSGELMRGPSGFKADFWQFEIETRVRVLSVHLASTAKELKLV